MADLDDRLLQNVAGPFFVDSACIDCDTCRCIGPEFFRRDQEHGYSIVYRQPEDEQEEEILLEALDCCPVEAIGRVE